MIFSTKTNVEQVHRRLTEGSKTRNSFLQTPEPCYQLGGKKTVSRHTQPFRNGARGYLERRSSVSTNPTDFHPNHLTSEPIRELPPPPQNKKHHQKKQGIRPVSQNELHLQHRSSSSPTLHVRSQSPTTEPTRTEPPAAAKAAR